MVRCTIRRWRYRRKGRPSRPRRPAATGPMRLDSLGAQVQQQCIEWIGGEAFLFDQSFELTLRGKQGQGLLQHLSGLARKSGH